MTPYSDIRSVKKRLTELRDVLPDIQGRNGELAYAKTIPIDIMPSAAETIEALDVVPFKDPIFQDFTSYFISKAFEVGEHKPVTLSGYCGVVGESGQMLDYLHSDPVSMRVTAAVVDNKCRVNPSTKICPDAVYDFELSQQISGLLNAPTIEVPDFMFLPSVEEGGFSQFVRNQAHTEQTLPLGTAKLALFATYNF